MEDLDRCLVIGEGRSDSELVPATIVDPKSPTLMALAFTKAYLSAIGGERDNKGKLISKVIPLGEEGSTNN